jgi:hypothetical protein
MRVRSRVGHRRPGRKDIRFGSAILLNAILIRAALILALTKILPRIEALACQKQAQSSQQQIRTNQTKKFEYRWFEIIQNYFML